MEKENLTVLLELLISIISSPQEPQKKTKYQNDCTLEEVIFSVHVWIVSNNIKWRPSCHHFKHQHPESPPVHTEPCKYVQSRLAVRTPWSELLTLLTEAEILCFHWSHNLHCQSVLHWDYKQPAAEFAEACLRAVSQGELKSSKLKILRFIILKLNIFVSCS